MDECKVESMEPNYLQNSLFSLEENFELRVQKKNGGKSEGAECTRQGGKWNGSKQISDGPDYFNVIFRCKQKRIHLQKNFCCEFSY